MIRSTDNKDCGPKRGCMLDSEFLWTGTLFTPLVCFLMFNVSDYTGRTLSNWCTQVGRVTGTYQRCTVLE